MELKGPGNNPLCSLATKPAHWHGLTFCLARGLHWQLQGTGPDPLGLTGTGTNRRKLFFCLQVVPPDYSSKEATVGLPSNSSISIQGLCWGQSLSGKQDSHGSVFSCASPDCTAGQRLMDEKGGVRSFRACLRFCSWPECASACPPILSLYIGATSPWAGPRDSAGAELIVKSQAGSQAVEKLQGQLIQWQWCTRVQ